MSDNNGNSKITAIYFLDANDCVFDGDTLIRMKRKYGKFKREVKCYKPNLKDNE